MSFFAAEKMRQMRDRLKSAGERLRYMTRFHEERATFLRQKAENFWQRARKMSPPPGEHAADAERARVWSDRSRLDPADAAPHAPGAERDTRSGSSGWSARYPGLANGLKIAAAMLLILLALPYILALLYRFVDPPFSALMARQALAGTGLHHQWIDFKNISPALPAAVVIAEDAGFCRHWGVDWSAVEEAIEDAEDGEKPRGASTIPMQTAKNLFLWNGPSYIRKALELPLAYFLSVLWPKQRLIEIYLNIAEWGPGIFGAEAAARYHFGKSASQLSGHEAALLAAVLPSPIVRNAGRPSARTARLAARIEGRVGREGQDASCIFRRSR